MSSSFVWGAARSLPNSRRCSCEAESHRGVRRPSGKYNYTRTSAFFRDPSHSSAWSTPHRCRGLGQLPTTADL